MVPGGKPLWHLDRIRADYPLVMHGVSMSIGSTAPLDRDYLRDLKALADRLQPGWVSDHLCWTGVDHRNLHDLLPMPLRPQLDHLTMRTCARSPRASAAPAGAGERLQLYPFAADEMSEAEFVAELLRRTGAGLLLDVNNIYVSSRNHGFDPSTTWTACPPARSVRSTLRATRTGATSSSTRTTTRCVTRSGRFTPKPCAALAWCPP